MSRQLFRRARHRAGVIANSALRHLGARVVAKDWGPLGFAHAFEKLRRRGFVPSQIIDVGAARGEWTRECMSVFPAANYFLVEPRHENVDHIADLEKTSPNVSHWLGAAGREPDELPLRLHDEQSSFLAGDYTDGQSTRMVRVLPLDDVLNQQRVSPPDLIKIDVQGFELEVLAGAAAALRSAKVLLIECSIRRIYRGGALLHEVVAACGHAGYRLLDICTYAARPADMELMQSDLLFCKDDPGLVGAEEYRIG
jgi:FkbM family methyltransferase